MLTNKIYAEDALTGLRKMPSGSVHCIVTSPPYYGLRDYGKAKQIGLEKMPELYIQKMVQIFMEAHRVLREDGTLWLNLGDTYASAKSRYSVQSQLIESSAKSAKKFGKLMTGSKPDLYNHPEIKDKDLIGIPWVVALALRKEGWYLRQDIIWHKPNPLPESVTDRCTKAHEYIFLLTKNKDYYFDADAIKTLAKNPNDNLKRSLRQKETNKSFPKDLQNGIRTKTEGNAKDYTIANKRSVWSVTVKSFEGAHFATFPPDLILDCIKAGCPKNGIVLDPFMGAGTTALVALQQKRKFIGFEINPDYIKISEKRILEELGVRI